MTTSQAAYRAITRLAARESKRPLLVGIDGFGGSGKSTLTSVLRQNPEVSAVVEGDDFYGPEGSGWAVFSPQEGYENFFDHERLARTVLRPLSRAEDTRYQHFDWQQNVLANWVELPAAGVVVVEGVYLLRPELREFWDLSIFVDTPWSTRLARQVSRGENEEDDIRRWADAEKHYEQAFDPVSCADLVVRGH